MEKKLEEEEHANTARTHSAGSRARARFVLLCDNLKSPDQESGRSGSGGCWETQGVHAKGRLRGRRKRRARRRTYPLSARDEWRLQLAKRLRENAKQRAARKLGQYSVSSSSLLRQDGSQTDVLSASPSFLSPAAPPSSASLLSLPPSTAASGAAAASGASLAPAGPSNPSGRGVSGVSGVPGVQGSPTNSPRDRLRLRANSRAGSPRSAKRTSGAATGSRAGLGSGGKNVSEESLHLHTLDEYSSAIFGDELSEWEDVVNFSDEEDELVDCPFTRRILGLDDGEDDTQEKRRRRAMNPAAEAAADLFSAKRLKRYKGEWGGQGRELMPSAPTSPVDTEVHRNPLFMNRQAQGILVTRKKSWSVPTREDTLVKHVNPLFQNLVLEAALQGTKKTWPQPPETPKRRLFPLRKMQSIPEMRPLHLPIKKAAEMKGTELKTENPLYRKILPK